jgi:chromosome segregation ATPase
MPHCSENWKILKNYIMTVRKLQVPLSCSFPPPFTANACLFQHQTEVDHLKSEFNRLQKSNAELADRMDKVKKLNDTLDARVQDLKKAASSDQAEIKDLRLKLRMSDHERTQMAAKQGDAGELKKSLQSLESRRRDEVRERDRRIADLEKALGGEKKKREDTGTKHLDLKAKTDEELLSSRMTVQKLEALVNTAQTETRDAQSALASLKVQSECKEEILLTQLEQHQLLLGQVAEEYGRLVSRTVPTSVHTRLKQEHTTLSTQSDRLERKLAWSQVQVVELTAMIRDAKEQVQFLTAQLHETEADASFYQSALVDVPCTLALQSNSSLESVFHAVHDEIAEQRHAKQTVDARSSELASHFYRLAYEELRLTFSVVDKQLHNEQLASQQHAADLSSALASHEAIAACLEMAQNERRGAEERLKTATELTDELRTSSDSIARQLKETEEKMRQAVAASDVALRKEKDTVQRLTSTVQKSRMAEEALRSEIEMYAFLSSIFSFLISFLPG